MRPSSWPWRVNDRHKKVVVLGTVHPEYLQVVKTYLSELKTEVVVIPAVDGVVPVAAVTSAIDADTCAVVMQQPNFFGCLEQVPGNHSRCSPGRSAGYPVV